MIEDIFKKFGNEVLLDMKARIPRATGKTADSLELKVTPFGFEIIGSQQILALVNGRKPTSSGAAAGDPTLKEAILGWIKARSITPREPSMSQETLAFLIARSIHQNGYAGKPDMFKNVLPESKIEKIENSLLLSKGVELTSSVIKSIK